MEGEGQWGIVSVPYRFDATLEEVQYNSGYYAMMQFSHYIKQGKLQTYLQNICKNIGKLLTQIFANSQYSRLPTNFCERSQLRFRI